MAKKKHPLGLAEQSVHIRLQLRPNQVRRKGVLLHAEVRAESDQELWEKSLDKILRVMGYTRAELTIGFILNMVNRQNETTRRMIATGIVQGMGLKTWLEEDKPCATLKQQFTPLEVEGGKLTPSGILIPD